MFLVLSCRLAMVHSLYLIADGWQCLNYDYHLFYSSSYGKDRHFSVGTLLLHKMVACHENILRIFQSECGKIDAVSSVYVYTCVTLLFTLPLFVLQLLMNLEGIRHIIEVVARLFVTGHTIATEKFLQAGRLWKLWELSLYEASRYGKHGGHDALCNVSVWRLCNTLLPHLC